MATIEAWTEVLAGCVPAEHLERCYIDAMRNRKSGFPLNVSELVQSWKEKVRDDVAVEASRNGPCKQCGGRGAITIAEPVERKHDIEIPCSWCRPDNYADWVNTIKEVKEQLGQAGFASKVIDATDAVLDMGQPFGSEQR